MKTGHVHPASFRDPSGYVFRDGDTVLRRIHRSYLPHYRKFMESGLYRRLVDEGLIVEHTERPDRGDDEFTVIEPVQIPYVSYPYEWCFSALRDAALVTLRVQQLALEHGMILKDASAYNVQFLRGRPVFIDTLSFESYEEGRPWVAYRQFCQHFLAPLALIRRVDHRLVHLLRAYLDGIPLDLASELLPWTSYFDFSVLAHLHLHARAQERFQDAARQKTVASARVSLERLKALVGHLHSTIASWEWKLPASAWGDYYSDTNYADTAMQHKLDLVADMLGRCEAALGAGPLRVADYGANTGRFSRLAASRGHSVVAHDIDHVAVERAYRERGTLDLLALFLDLANPAPGLGWDGVERDSFGARQRVDVAMMLAVVHHLVFSANLRFGMIAGAVARWCRFLVIEFVPRSDSQVERLLATRKDVFGDYEESAFEAAFGAFFDILEKAPVRDSRRVLYLMERRG